MTGLKVLCRCSSIEISIIYKTWYAGSYINLLIQSTIANLKNKFGAQQLFVLVLTRSDSKLCENGHAASVNYLIFCF